MLLEIKINKEEVFFSFFHRFSKHHQLCSSASLIYGYPGYGKMQFTPSGLYSLFILKADMQIVQFIRGVLEIYTEKDKTFFFVFWQSRALQLSRNLYLLSPHLCFFIVSDGDLFVYRDDPLRVIMRTEQPTKCLYHFKSEGEVMHVKLV